MKSRIFTHVLLTIGINIVVFFLLFFLIVYILSFFLLQISARIIPTQVNKS